MGFLSGGSTGYVGSTQFSSEIFTCAKGIRNQNNKKENGKVCRI